MSVYYKLCSIVILLIIGQVGVIGQERCGEDWISMQAASMVPDYEQRVTNNTKRLREAIRSEGLTIREPMVIPIVVHVVYNNDNKKISESQVLSQIEQLNADYEHLIIPSTIPAEFAHTWQDAGIRFCLAARDPEGNPTNGIVYRQTSVKNIGIKANGQGRKFIHHNYLGGSDAWPTSRYLNIWVCRLDEYLGYATGPDNIAFSDEDGVVINYSNFGNIGTVDPKSRYNMGRTATHEVGHYLGLLHLWGKNASGCGDDLVEDTPQQGTPHYECPDYPQLSCFTSNMFMNFMDYVNDPCMYFFSKGQGERMRATVSTFRPGLLSGGLTACDTSGIATTPLKDRIRLKSTLVDGFITLLQTRPGNEVLNIELFDESGRLIKKYTKIPQSEFNLYYDRMLSPGMYFLRISTKDEHTTLKVFIKG